MELEGADREQCNNRVIRVLLRRASVLTGRAGSVSWALRLRPRWEDGGGMTDSSSVVLLPSTAEVCRTLASSMMVWSVGEMDV